MIYSFLGWIYETVLCTVKDGKWENRGFLYGPVCPIYGTGAVTISLIINIASAGQMNLRFWQIFIISVIGSAVLEYVTSWLLEKLFHAVWWDYSDLPLNLNGRISLFTSLGFGLAGLLIVYVLAPVTENIVSLLPAIAVELLALLFVAVFMVDITLTVTELLHVDRVVAQMEKSFNRNMEDFVSSTMERTKNIRKNVIIKKKYVAKRINLLSGCAKAAMKRIYAFRYNNKNKENAGNRFLLLLKKSGRKK